MAEESEFQKIDPAQLGLLYVRKYFGTGVKVTVDTGVEDRIGTGIKLGRHHLHLNDNTVTYSGDNLQIHALE